MMMVFREFMAPHWTLGGNVHAHFRRHLHRHLPWRRQAVWRNFAGPARLWWPACKERRTLKRSPAGSITWSEGRELCSAQRAPRRNVAVWIRSKRREATPLRRRANREGWRGQRGSVLVEAALVLPVIMTMLLGLVEFGFIWKDELTINNAVRSAARVGSASGKSNYVAATSTSA